MGRHRATGLLLVTSIAGCGDVRNDASADASQDAQSAGSTGDATPDAGEESTAPVENPPGSCGEVLAIDERDPMAVLQAVELCERATDPDGWGLVSAAWVLADGSPAPDQESFHLGHGVLPGFGAHTTPRAGATLLALSSGTARRPGDPGYVSPEGFDKQIASGNPPGFPKETPFCPGVTTGDVHDDAAIELRLRPPPDAQGFSFDFAFYTLEWPGYVCSGYNDLFLALVAPPPAGHADGNISFDPLGNLISVNSALLGACKCDAGTCYEAGQEYPCPCPAGGKEFTCPLGPEPLVGTGFDAGAGTGWLVTTSPLAPREEIELRWAIHDSGDGIVDSTTLLDNWQWLTEAGLVLETKPAR